MITTYLYKKDEDKTLLACMVIGAMIGLIFSAIVNLSQSTPDAFIGIIFICIIITSIITVFITSMSDKTFIQCIIIMVCSNISSIVICGAFAGIGNLFTQFPLWESGLIVIIMTEILFFLDKTQPDYAGSTKERINFTVERKLEAFGESAIIFLSSIGIYNKIILPDSNTVYLYVLFLIKIILIISAVIIIGYAYFWISSLRYKK